MDAWLDRVHQGDCIELLRELPSASVHCCVTSPPYWGLRDYGTGTWVGGDANCNHTPERKRGDGSSTLDGGLKMQSHRGDAYGAICPKCGAQRVDQQMGLEPTPEEYVAGMVEVFGEVRRVLRDDGTLWLNVGDSFCSGGREGHGTRIGYKQQTNRGMDGSADPPRAAQPPGLKPKDLVGIPWRLAFALQADGWYLRSDIIWAKPNPMPESVRDRPTKSHEYVFLLTKSGRYYWDQEAVREPCTYVGRIVDHEQASTHLNPTYRAHSGGYPNANGGRNIRDVWTIPTSPCPEAHFAVMPSKLVEPCVKAGTSERGCCPQCGAPWHRVIVRTDQIDESARGSRFDAGKTVARDGGDRTQAGERTTKQTLGWRPTCTCDAGEPEPCTVLDPFMGAGTVGMVATSLGRHYIGIELNPEYIAIAEDRIDTARRKLSEHLPLEACND